MEVSFSFIIFLSVSLSLFLSVSLSLSLFSLSSLPQINDNLYLSLLVRKVLGLCVLVMGVS